LSVKNIVAQYQAYGIVRNKIFTDNETLSQPVGVGLFGILDADAEIRSVAQQALV
jgi:hypothetical protein